MRTAVQRTATRWLVCAVCASGVAYPAANAHPTDLTINVISATYGANCGARVGNATSDVARHCNQRRECAYQIDMALPDDGRVCSADFVSEWRCGQTEFHRAAVSPGFGSGSTLVLTCVRPEGAGK
jgi:hypothetical protein